MTAPAMKISPVPPADTTESTAMPAEVAQQREIDQLRVAHANVPWHLSVELVAQAVGLPVGQPLAVGKTPPAPGSLAHRLGHRSVEAFVTGAPQKHGLAQRWSEFSRDVTAHGYRKRYALESGTPAEVIEEVAKASRILTRPPENAAEYHRIVKAQVEHELAAEVTRRRRMESGLSRDRDEWRGRAEKAESNHRTLEATLANTKADHERAVSSLRAEHDRTVAELQSEHERTLTLLQGDIKVLRSELDTTTSARETERALLDEMTRRADSLREALDLATKGEAGDLLSLQAEIRELNRSLRSARSLVKKQRRRIRKLMAENKQLQRLCKERLDSIRRATSAIRGLKADREERKVRSHRWHIAGGVLLALASAGWALALA